MDLSFIWIFVGIAALIGVVIVIAVVQEKRRKENLRLLADELGFAFNDRGDIALLESLGAFQLFSQGHGKNLWNLLRGNSANVEVAVFDYKYTTGSGKNKSSSTQTVVCIRSAHFSLPDFTLSPEHFFHRIGALFGFHDIDFVTHPTFSKKYLLRGSDEAAIRNVFTPELLEFFEQKPGLSVEGRGGTLLVYRHSKIIAPADVRGAIDDGIQMLGRLIAAG